MKLIRDIKQMGDEGDSLCLLMGNFDGVHKGHMSIIKRILEENRRDNLKLLLTTFIPHPKEVIGRNFFFLINSYEEKKDLLSRCGVDFLLEIKFDKTIQSMSMEFFFDFFFGDLKNLKKIYLGHDFKAGMNQKGDGESAKRFFSKKNIQVTHLEQIRENSGEIISSSRIRDCLKRGKMEDANRLLGRSFFISGTVVSGKGRGRKIGYPTANLQYEKNRIVPEFGVYYTKTSWMNEIFNSVTNVGVNPTFKGDKILIESHIMDFDGDLYDKKIKVFFLKKHRDEIKFADRDELMLKINDDIRYAREWFSR